MLVLGAGDIGHGGSGADSFVLGDWIDGNGMAVIQDFDPATDRLVISYDPAVSPDPAVSVAAAPEGGMLLQLDGQTVAHLTGTETLDPATVELAPDWLDRQR